MFALNSWWVLIISVVSTGLSYSQYINEFHYDNAGNDEGEFIEIVLLNPQPVDLQNYKLYTYNGADSMTTLTRSVSGLMPICQGDSCFYVWSRQELLQNGPRDGIALAYEGETDTFVFDFISYEGELMALNGPAQGMVSMDVGVSETSSTPIGWSLQKDATGTWIAAPATPGSINPIELVEFKGAFIEEIDAVQLEWLTVSEINNEYFEVQRSRDQIYFQSIGSVEGAGTRQDTLSYGFLDVDPYSGKSYYRLQQVDTDGTYSYSEVIEVKCPVWNSLKDLVPIFRDMELRFISDGFGKTFDVNIYDSQGKLLLYRKNFHPDGVIHFNSPACGVMFFQIQSKFQSHSGAIVMQNVR